MTNRSEDSADSVSDDYTGSVNLGSENSGANKLHESWHHELSTHNAFVSASSLSTLGPSLPFRRKVLLKKCKGPLSENTLQGVANFILSGKCSNVVVVTGAGISTSSGIPDFRTPGSGIYNNLEEFNLPSPECIFDLSYFKSNPEPLYTFGRNFMDLVSKARPTTAHYFIKLLADKRVLLRNYTQNVDGLERIAGLDPSYLVEAHGTLSTASCVECHQKFDTETFYNLARQKKNVFCDRCGSYIKPDVILFGESLHKQFFELVESDCRVCDLMLIMGTSLSVYPVSMLTQFIPPGTPRLLISKEKINMSRRLDDDTSSYASSESSSQFEQFKEIITDEALPEKELTLDDDQCEVETLELTTYDRDVTWIGSCDDGCFELIKLLKWEDDFNALRDK